MLAKKIPLFKDKNNKFHLANWVVNSFPENYETLHYLEPFVGTGSVLFNKKISELEIINDQDINLIRIYQALRDEPKVFISRLKKCKCTEITFNRALKRTQLSKNDYMDDAIDAYIVKKMSVGGHGTKFSGSNHLWEKGIEQLPSISKRLVSMHIFQKNPCVLIKIFSESNVFAYLDPVVPNKDDENYVQEMEKYLKIIQHIHSFAGKILFNGFNTTADRIAFKGWRCIKKQGEKRVLWANY